MMNKSLLIEQGSNNLVRKQFSGLFYIHHKSIFKTLLGHNTLKPKTVVVTLSSISQLKSSSS